MVRCIKTDAKHASLADYMNNRTKIPIADGVVAFPVDADPKALILDGATRAETVLTDWASDNPVITVTAE